MAFMYTGPQSAWVNAQHQKNMQRGSDTSELEKLQLDLLKAEVANAQSQNLGDAPDAEIPDNIRETIGLNAEQIQEVLARTIENREEFETMARQMVA